MHLISDFCPDASDGTLVCYKGLPYSRDQPLSHITYMGGFLEKCDCWYGLVRLPDNTKHHLRIQLAIEDRETTVREVKIQITERVPNVFRGDLNLTLLECHDNHPDRETPADDSLIATWKLGHYLSVMDMRARTVHFVDWSGIGFDVAVPVDHKVVQALKHKDVRRGRRHNLYCDAVVSEDRKRLDPNANFGDSVPRRGEVHIFENPLVFILSFSSRGKGRCVSEPTIPRTRTHSGISNRLPTVCLHWIHTHLVGSDLRLIEAAFLKGKIRAAK
jgi:hypothetical protein